MHSMVASSTYYQWNLLPLPLLFMLSQGRIELPGTYLNTYINNHALKGDVKDRESNYNFNK